MRYRNTGAMLAAAVLLTACGGGHDGGGSTTMVRGSLVGAPVTATALDVADVTTQIKALEDLPPNDFRRLTPKYSPANFIKIMDLVHKFEGVAKNHGATPAQASIAWLMAQGEDIIPIPGTRTIKYLEQNTEAARLKLTEKEVQELRVAADATELPGDRYPAM